MRLSATWMTIWDDRILEYLLHNESATPKELDESGYVKVSRSQISRRLSKLNENGLLRHLGNGVYVISDKGKAYLNEEYNVEEDVYVNDEDIEPPEPSVESES